MTGDAEPAVGEAALAHGYRQCARITRTHGTTYYWGTLLLPRDRQRHVHAVYALCRLADDIVDDPDTGRNPGEIEADLSRFIDRFTRSLARGYADDPILAAIVHTVQTCQIPIACFERFFAAMAMDLTTCGYQTWTDLCAYMDGSAAVIGEMMLPVLTPIDPAAIGPARALGLAFQLTNFLRDVGEDLDRGRVYLPQEDLDRFGADPWLRTASPQWQALMAFEVARARALYTAAGAGIAMLPPRSARCVAAALSLYQRILDRVEAADYDVFSSRARVPTWHKAAVAAGTLMFGTGATPTP
jgi:phytoene synthase